MRLLCLFALALPLATEPGTAAPVTLYLELGQNAEAVDAWDGRIQVSGGELLKLEERHFSANDELTGENSWRASTRREQVAGFARMNYNEMSPAHLPPTQFSPIGLFATVETGGNTQVSVKTRQGNFEFRVADIGEDPSKFLQDRAMVGRSGTVEKLSIADFEDDEAAITTLPNGDLAAAWVAYREQGDRVMVRVRSGGEWGSTMEATTAPGDIFRCSLAADSGGGLWAFWSERQGTVWNIYGRRRLNGSWGSVEKLSGDGTNTFHRASNSDDGDVFVVWQSYRGAAGEAQSDIVGRSFSDGKWTNETKFSESPANDWEPQVAGGPKGSAYVVWDSYHSGNYDVFFRAYEGGELGPVQQLTDSERFQAHASVAVDGQGRPWVAWDESGVNWGKDQGYLITPPMAVPLHQERSIRIAMWNGADWVEPKAKLEPFYTYRLHPNFENPQIRFDGQGTLNMVFRKWTRQRAHSIGARITWENFLTRFDGESWTRPVPLPHSAGSIEKRPALTRDADGNIHAAWMTDNRIFAELIPQNAEIYYAGLGKATSAPNYGAEQFAKMDDPFAEAVPIHPFEEQNIEAIRDYTIEAGDKKFKIYRGDMHRHTDISQDFKYDGSLIEVYRYAMDVTAFDYMVPTDHQLGYDQEFTWWQDEKLTDLFNVPGSFVPMFGYERSLTFPNGHRNVIFSKRGTRPLPIPNDERRGEVYTGANLYPYLKQNNGISMPHSSGTSQGTDWFDNDPDVEPLMEIFQGYRASYEYMGAPLAASPQKLREQRSGFNPIGYYWDALAKGYKIGVQASSDHWSTHISYAMIVAEEHTRESMFSAMKQRHAYAATDNIILDFQIETDNGKRYIMGDIIDTNPQSSPRLIIKALGADRIKQLVIVKNQEIIYTRHPNADSVTLRYTDNEFEPGKNYYYVRVLQNNGMVAWSSPIWLE